MPVRDVRRVHLRRRLQRSRPTTTPGDPPLGDRRSFVPEYAPLFPTRPGRGRAGRRARRARRLPPGPPGVPGQGGLLEHGSSVRPDRPRARPTSRPHPSATARRRPTSGWRATSSSPSSPSRVRSPPPPDGAPLAFWLDAPPARRRHRAHPRDIQTTALPIEPFLVLLAALRHRPRRRSGQAHRRSAVSATVSRHDVRAGRPGPRRGPVRAVIVALRPAEWVKNGFVFAPLIFSAASDETDLVWPGLAATGAFCLMASAGYLVNDLAGPRARSPAPDEAAPADRRRRAPGRASRGARRRARRRPPRARRLARRVGPAACRRLRRPHLQLLAVLKRLVIVDVMTIAAGFLVRVLAGAPRGRVEATRSG